MRILFVADVFGVPGRRAVEEVVPRLRAERDVDFCVINGENVADGAGITPRLAERLLAAGADVITLGNHVWRRGEIGAYLEDGGARRPAGEPLLGDAPAAGSSSRPRATARRSR